MNVTYHHNFTDPSFHIDLIRCSRSVYLSLTVNSVIPDENMEPLPRCGMLQVQGLSTPINFKDSQQKSIGNEITKLFSNLFQKTFGKEIQLILYSNLEKLEDFFSKESIEMDMLKVEDIQKLVMVGEKLFESLKDTITPKHSDIQK
ncbi:hypothetical protein SNEBB_007945 [Seison nebaliae]|nr:hypothetical protein SNEBB_007945 [Seison nebaliae]